MLSAYIGSPVSAYQRNWNQKVTDVLRQSGVYVYLPQEITPKLKSHKHFELYVYERCIDMMLSSNFGLLLLPYGRDCAWEVGYYEGISKPLYLFADYITKDQQTRLRDWMVKGSINAVVTTSKISHSKLKADPILRGKPLHLIKSMRYLPDKLASIYIQSQSVYIPHFVGAGAVVTTKGKVLLVKEQTDSTFYNRRKGKWGFPTTTVINNSPERQSLLSLGKETGIKGLNPKFISIENIPNATGLFYRVRQVPTS